VVGENASAVAGHVGCPTRSGGSPLIVYVSCAADKEVTILEMDRHTGGLSKLDAVPVPGTSEPSPISMPLAVSPCQHFLFAVLRSPPFPVTSFTISSTNGGLAPLGTSWLEDSMAYIATDRSGAWLLAASLSGQRLTVNAIGSDGGVRRPPAQTVPIAGKVHSVLTDPANRFAYAAVLDANRIMQFRFDELSGNLTPTQPGFVVTADNAGPRHMRFHPDGSVLYVVNESGGTIDAFSVSAGNGQLAWQQTVELLPAAAATRPWASDIQITPDGRFLYASERRSSMISGFRVAPGAKTLGLIGRVPCAAVPRGFAIDPSGRFLIAAGATSNRVTVFSIDPQEGRLRPKSDSATGANPNWIEIVDLARD
jgi:6-phosphogluconolactonase